MEKRIYLPGGGRQSRMLVEKLDIRGFKILVMGSFSEIIALRLAKITGEKVELIVEDYESLISSRLILENDELVNARLMDYEITDFEDNTFDLIYTQGGISTGRRNKIVKEIKRLLKPERYLCVGEVVDLTREVPPFVVDIYENSGLYPLYKDEVSDFYRRRNFDVLYDEDISATLKDFYSLSAAKLEESTENFDEKEKSYYKKLINRISHESAAYLKQGGSKHIGFRTLLLKWTGI